jgi:DNA-binding MarR family transcriptional regulator
MNAGGEPDGRALAKADYERLAAFRQLLRQFTAFSEAAADAAGLTPQQHQALLAIKGFPGRDRVSIGELAERLGIQHHSGVGLADRLAARNLVRRRPDDEDRRQVYLELTEAAETALAELSQTHRSELQRLAPALQALLHQFGEG